MTVAVKQDTASCVLCEVKYPISFLMDGLCENCKDQVPPEPDIPPSDDELTKALEDVNDTSSVI